MTEKVFEQEFKGYWRAGDNRGLPTYSGIFVVQSYYHDRDKSTVSMNDLIYIGAADNINERVRNHEKKSLWKQKLKPGEQFCYSCTPVRKEDRERIVAALIHVHQPPANSTYVDTFPFDTTRIRLCGDYPVLEKEIVAETS
ncbi:GIY-YIG nuclease family protein [Sinomicrobium weinanense]|uniref:GIY-YIG nuclease family protein n=1 Tax=Sinomicrobium weinanense TaxID=2842200 RepID=A0A926Q3K9_9FLAO|nr:GIY-YIG nuclease family protein [Sinomicrobium weinanense]MBC9795895.1 GIY-YIG nuclease family protein [Sinomicrobium weinanense]MBU3124726.1 GIY-YIG nuclease family protein [Sinomicrobium weinanense]